MALHIVTVMLSVSTTVASLALAQDAPAQPAPPAQQTQPRSGRAPQPTSKEPAAPATTSAAPGGGAEDLLSPYDREALTAEYRIAPGDLLQVFVWREPDLSRELRVRPDGYVSVPLIGDLFAVARADIKRNPFHPFSSFDTATLGGVAFGQTVLSRAVIAAGFDWDPAGAHSAIYDAQRTAELFCAVCNRFRGIYEETAARFPADTDDPAHDAAAASDGEAEQVRGTD